MERVLLKDFLFRIYEDHRKNGTLKEYQKKPMIPMYIRWPTFSNELDCIRVRRHLANSLIYDQVDGERVRKLTYGGVVFCERWTHLHRLKHLYINKVKVVCAGPENSAIDIYVG